MRTILTWRILGEDLVGTRHVPTPGRSGGLSGAPAVGILLLNSGPTARSGNSDLSVRIGDRLALRGFPVFRFDLPGLGDSSGPTPTNLDAYWSEVVNGRNDEATVALIERIQLECGLARVVVGGLCAAVVPIVRALSHASAAPAGLVLLEPNFRLPASVPEAQPEAIDPVGERVPALRRIWFHGLRGLRASRFARATRPLRDSLRTHFGSRLSKDANVALIRSWQASFAREIPSLVVVAAGQGTDLYVARILEATPERARGAVACTSVPGTNHLLTSGVGPEAVLTALESWMTERFGGKDEASAERVKIGTPLRNAV